MRSLELRLLALAGRAADLEQLLLARDHAGDVRIRFARQELGRERRSSRRRRARPQAGPGAPHSSSSS